MKANAAPEIEVTDFFFNGINPQNMDLTVRISVKSPLLTGASIKKVCFDIYRVEEDGHEEYIGHGEKSGIKLEAGTENRIDIPVTLKNRSLLYAAADFLAADITISVKGSLFLDLKIFAPEFKFEKKKTVKGLFKRLSE
ncbi:hypothetical protein J2128_001288 [Methanomicrobium sp. W14]|uniref:hypothetical protein n=1 Tax=Methanomicrobium sp. W14 TaxID=2817839 RepID=UPI001AE49F20|nr:hypothetical protein [Methanomicrobium sp. W14]MBP2133334.1 hypothetical protein [Methanomicrobium sp. W14]